MDRQRCGVRKEKLALDGGMTFLRPYMEEQLLELQFVDKRVVVVDNQWDRVVGNDRAEAILILRKEQIQGAGVGQGFDTPNETSKADIDAAADTGLRLMVLNRREGGAAAVDRHSREGGPDGDRRLRCRCALDRRPI